MSLKTIINAIGKFFSKIWKSLSPTLKNAVHIGVTITEAIKNYDAANPGTIDLLTKIIPGDLDDKLKEKIRTNLPDVMLQLRLVDTSLNLTDPAEIVAAAIDMLNKMGGIYRKQALNDLSIAIANVAADGKLNWDDAVYILKYYYDHKPALETPAVVA